MKQRADGARRAAVAALVRMHRGGWAAAAAGALTAAQLSPRDKMFAGALFYGSAERLVTLDFLLTPFLKKPVEKLDAEVRAILECGLYQMLYMRVPQSAAVNESVCLARAFGKTSAAGFVNAVLRRAAALATQPGAGPDFTQMSFESERQRVCVQWAVSAAVAGAVMAVLPGEYDEYFAASFSSGELCLRCNTLKTNREELAAALAAQGAAVRAGSLPQALYAVIPGGPAQQPLFAAGHYHVQGEASQYACANLGAQSGQRVLDLCAAPGGKAATLAQEMGGGAGLVACDARESRLPLIHDTLGRLGLTGVRVLQNDATVFRADWEEKQNRVLCDVPCSGLGVLAQKPDLRTADGAGFATLPALQLKILQTAARYVKGGGRLVYSTCTLRQEENAAVVREFLRENSDYKVVKPEYCPQGALIRDNMMTILPHKTGMDGFFVACLVRL